MTVPRHIGIILDGNRRFAKRLMIKPWKGHEWGAKKFHQFLKWCNEIGVEEVTAYVFSIQNFNRPKEEFNQIMRIFGEEFDRLLKPENLAQLKEAGTRIMFVGRISMLPEDVQTKAHELMKQTKDFGKRRVNFALAYGGREEIIDATQKIAQAIKDGKIEPEQVNEEYFGKQLWLDSDPDIVIRTGGERRTSNFLPWQATYAELMFVEKFWPEFEKEDFLQCIADYENRERRFGK